MKFQIYTILFLSTSSLVVGMEFRTLDVEFLPPSARNVSSLKLENCTIRRLQESTPLVWPNLKDIHFKSVKMQESLWPQLIGAIKLESLSVNGNLLGKRMENIGRTFRESVPSALKVLTLERTGTRKLETGSMSHLSNLFLLKFFDMPLAEFPRSALPSRMPSLRIFMLGDTPIEKLEKNFFDHMPRLGHVFLSNNRLTTLPHNLFTPLKQSHLGALVLSNNPFECGCGLIWLPKNYKGISSTEVSGTCFDKSGEKELMSLRENDYC